MQILITKTLIVSDHEKVVFIWRITKLPTTGRPPTTDPLTSPLPTHRPPTTNPPTSASPTHRPLQPTTDQTTSVPSTHRPPIYRQVLHRSTDHRLTDSTTLLQLTNNPLTLQSYFNRATIGPILSAINFSSSFGNGTIYY